MTEFAVEPWASARRAELDALLAACADVPEWTQADARRWWLLHRPERS